MTDETFTVATEMTREEAEAYLNNYSSILVQYTGPGIVVIRKFTEQIEKALFVGEPLPTHTGPKWDSD